MTPTVDMLDGVSRKIYNLISIKVRLGRSCTAFMVFILVGMVPTFLEQSLVIIKSANGKKNVHIPYV